MSSNSGYAVFTEEMRKTHTILVPNMLPMHFKIILRTLDRSGYKTELLETSGSHIAETGLKFVHNDTCYPAILVIGQFMDALLSGRYDTDKVALLLTQTGGGCRASNYISLLRKALEKAGLSHVPVISLNFSGMENSPGFKLDLNTLVRMMYGVFYGDLLMLLRNRVKPYETEKGACDRLCDMWTERLAEEMSSGRVKYKKVKQNYAEIVSSFANIDTVGPRKVRVGIVGEIFVKFSPLGNNDLEEFLMSQDCEVVVPGLMDFLLYCVYNGIIDWELYGFKKLKAIGSKILYKFLIKKQNEVISAVTGNSFFEPMGSFDHTKELVKGIVGLGTKMGEGWLLTAEMVELIEQGVGNIVCTQPFGCLPNHIVGKGMMKPIKERYEDVNIVAIDYDPGATKINQENRIKLMLANARPAQETVNV